MAATESISGEDVVDARKKPAALLLCRGTELKKTRPTAEPWALLASSSVRKKMRRLLIHLVLLYRATLGRLLGGQCRFTPTCSQYAIDAINKHGPLRGSWMATKRICRCHPWGGRGYDPA